MLTEDFKSKVLSMGYMIQITEKILGISKYISNASILVTIRLDKPYAINTDHDKDVPQDLYRLCVKYAGTPLEEREPKKKKIMKIDGLYVSRINSDFRFPKYPYINTDNTMESSTFSIGYTEFKNSAETFTDVQIENYKKYLNFEVEDAPEK